MPWHLFNSPEIIHYTLDTLGAAIGPLYGILVADYFLVRHEHLFVDDLYSDQPDGHYWYQGGFNPNAIWALIVGALVGMVFVFVPAAALPGRLRVVHRRGGRRRHLLVVDAAGGRGCRARGAGAVQGGAGLTGAGGGRGRRVRERAR